MDSMTFATPRSKDFVDWSVAYERVELYFLPLRIENKLLLSQLIADILSRASNRLNEGSPLSPSVIAMQEARKEVNEWFRAVLVVRAYYRTKSERTVAWRFFSPTCPGAGRTNSCTRGLGHQIFWMQFAMPI